MAKMKRTKRRKRKMRRLPNHQQRRVSENYISRKLVQWFAFVSSLVIRTDKLATLVSEPASCYVNDDDCYINISHCFYFKFFF